MNRIRNSWELAKISWGVLGRDRELLWLPVLSFLSWLAVAALVFVPLVLSSGVDSGSTGDAVNVGPMQYVVLFVGGVALAYVTIFFRAAILHAADERLRGGDPSVQSALSGAATRAGRLLPWAILSVTVSMVLRAIEERSGVLGRVVMGFVGLAWTLVTFLVLPVLVLEDVGVFDAVKRSAELFKRTWGENVAAQMGFSVLGLLAMLPAVLVVVLLSALGSVGVVVGIALAALWIGVVSVVLAALSAIFQMALYRFAVDGVAPGPFAGSDLGRAFQPRRSGFGRAL